MLERCVCLELPCVGPRLKLTGSSCSPRPKTNAKSSEKPSHWSASLLWPLRSLQQVIYCSQKPKTFLSDCCRLQWLINVFWLLHYNYRTSPVKHSHWQRGGESFPPLHSKPKATRRIHRPPTLLPQRKGVQHHTFWTGGKSLGLQRYKWPYTVSKEPFVPSFVIVDMLEAFVLNAIKQCVLFSPRFSVNRRIFVVGFGLYGSIHGPTDYQVNIQVWIPEKHSAIRV